MRTDQILPDPKVEPGTPPTEPNADPGKAKEPAEVADKLVTKHGSALDALRVVVNENHSYRDQIRELKAKVPGDGVVVLSGDDASAWAEYRSLGKPVDLRKAVKDRDDFAGQIALVDREKEVKAVAKAANLDPEKFAELTHGLEFDWQEEDVKGDDGKTTKIKVPIVKGEGDEKVKVVDHPRISQFLSVLKLEPEKPLSKGTPSRTGTTKPIVPAVPPKREPSLVR